MSVIKSLAGKETERVFRRGFSRRLPKSIQRAAHRKLLQIHAATVVRTLRVPTGNRPEILSRDRTGQHSIRINDQWRICFTSEDGHAYDVEITDYH